MQHMEWRNINHSRNNMKNNCNTPRYGYGMISLTLKAPIMTAADDNHKYFFHCFSEKIRLDVSNESSARQRIH